MNANDIISLVNNIAFPIVACIGCGWFIKYEMDTFNKQLEALRKENKETTDSLSKALENNTIALNKLCDRLDK